MYEYTIQRIIIEKALDTPLFYGATLLQKILKSFFYLFPLYISLASAIFLLRKKSPLIILPVFCIMLYLLGIRPTTDYVHLVPLLAVTGLPLLILTINIKQKPLQVILGIIFTLYIVSGFYTAIFTGFYRWQKPLLFQTEYLSLEKGHIWVSKDNAKEINKIVSTVKTYTPGNQNIFVYDYQPMIYFLTKKQNPTKFDLLAHNGYFLKAMPEVIQTLEKKQIKLIITNKSFYYDNTSLAKYIKGHYTKAGESENFYFLRKQGESAIKTRL